eukprot:scaffold65962_cov25-Tisochrysis_lutea.AAC.3
MVVCRIVWLASSSARTGGRVLGARGRAPERLVGITGEKFADDQVPVSSEHGGEKLMQARCSNRQGGRCIRRNGLSVGRV